MIPNESINVKDYFRHRAGKMKEQEKKVFSIPLFFLTEIESDL